MLIYRIAFSAPGAHRAFLVAASRPIGFLYHDAITRYWTVVERNTLPLLLVARLRQRVFLYNACSGAP